MKLLMSFASFCLFLPTGFIRPYLSSWLLIRKNGMDISLNPSASDVKKIPAVRPSSSSCRNTMSHHQENHLSIICATNVSYSTTSSLAMSKRLSGGDISYSNQMHRLSNKIINVVHRNSFLFSMVAAVSLAKIFPSLGVNGGILKPELFLGRFGVTMIFLISGLSLEIGELQSAFANVKLNFLVQLGSFFAWPFLIGVPLTTIISRQMPNFLPHPLLEGLLILTCLPTTVNMCVLLTSSAGGNVAASLANAVMGNILGIFVTPALLMYFFGTTIELPFMQMIWKLINKVLVPVVVGQMMRATQTKDFFISHKKAFKSLQEYILIGLVWNAFCNAFTKGLGIEMHHGIFLIVLLSALHLGSYAACMKFFSSKMLNFRREDVIAATFCTSHKTLAFGLPLLNTIFEGNVNLAAYCAPIMFLHPLQLLLGSILVGRIRTQDQQQ